MDNWIRNIIFIFWLLINASCKKDSACFHSYGKDTSFSISTSPYDSVVVSGDFNLNLIQSNEYRVEIVGGENNAKFIEIEHENEKLTLSNRNKCNWLRDYDKELQVNLYFEDLYEIRSTGQTYIYNDTPLILDTLFVHITGVGDIKLSFDSLNYLWSEMYVLGDLELEGNMNTLNCNVTSFGNLKAKNLRANNLFIETSNEGDAHIYPMQFTKATCSSIGNIFYYNEGEVVEILESGKGKYLKGE